MEDPPSLGQYIASSRYILALVGAGLSASSGIPTFRGDGATWRARRPTDLASRGAFAKEPVLVSLFYEDRRRKAAAALPNAAHFALAKLADLKSDLLTISQNIDGLLERAGHLPSKLAPIHGSLFSIKCNDPQCTFTAWHDQTPDLFRIPQPANGDISDPNVELPPLTIEDLPRCPTCRTGLLRPGVVWFGEQLPLDLLGRVDSWLDSIPRIDLVLVIGTSARVFPAAEYIDRAKAKGAYAAYFNTERDEDLIDAGDWYVPGDAATTLPLVVAEALEYSSSSGEVSVSSRRMI